MMPFRPSFESDAGERRLTLAPPGPAGVSVVELAERSLELGVDLADPGAICWVVVRPSSAARPGLTGLFFDDLAGPIDLDDMEWLTSLRWPRGTYQLDELAAARSVIAHSPHPAPVAVSLIEAASLQSSVSRQGDEAMVRSDLAEAERLLTDPGTVTEIIDRIDGLLVERRFPVLSQLDGLPLDEFPRVHELTRRLREPWNFPDTVPSARFRRSGPPTSTEAGRMAAFVGAADAAAPDTDASSLDDGSAAPDGSACVRWVDGHVEVEASLPSETSRWAIVVDEAATIVALGPMVADQDHQARTVMPVPPSLDRERCVVALLEEVPTGGWVGERAVGVREAARAGRRAARLDRRGDSLASRAWEDTTRRWLAVGDKERALSATGRGAGRVYRRRLGLVVTDDRVFDDVVS